MKAVSYEVDGKKGLILNFSCQKCGAMTRNVANQNDPNCPDDYDKILGLTPELP
jgi:hypothetical protein